MSSFRLGAAVAGALVALHAAAAVPTRYDVADIGVSGHYAIPTGLNASGQVVGYLLERSGHVHAWATGPQGRPIYAPCPSASLADCRAVGIDDAGQVAMSIQQPNGANASAISAADGSGLRYLHGIVGKYNAVGGISPGGLLTGLAGEGGQSVGYRASQDSVRPRPLGEMGGRAINDAGVAVGASFSTLGHPMHAVVAVPGSRPQSLGYLPGGYRSTADAISNTGWIAGYAQKADGNWDATLARLGTPGLTDLGTLDGGAGSSALGVNDAGLVVGVSDTAAGGVAAFALDASDLVMVDLNTRAAMPAGVVLQEAVAINAKGQIAAIGSDGGVYLLTPR